MNLGSRLMAPILIGLAVLLAYANSLNGGFHYDDLHSIVSNPSVRKLGNLGRFFVDPGAFSADPDKSMYRPLLLVTYALNHAWGGYQPVGYRLVNLALHLIAALLVWGIARRVGAGSPGALLAGLLFALQPLATEPVNYVSSRSESLAACFFLGSFFLYTQAGDRPSLGALICFAAGLLTKEVVIVLPVLLWLYDRWIPRRAFAVRRHLGFWLVGGTYLSILAATRFLSTSLAAAPRGMAEQLWTQAKALVYYLWLLAVPVRLNVEHQFKVSPWPLEPAVVLALLLLISLVYLVWRGASRPARFWLAWAALVLMPATLTPLNVLVNEHRLYLSVAGMAVLAGYLWTRVAGPRLARPAVVALLLLWLVLVHQRNQAWADEVSLWQDSVTHSPLMTRPHVHLGDALMERGQTAAARREYEAALRLDPDNRPARTNLANLLLEAGLQDPVRHREELLRAVEEYRRVLALDPGYREALNNLGAALSALGRTDEAEQAYLQAVTRYPNFADGYVNLALLASGRGDHPRAVEYLRRAVALRPDAASLGQLGDAAARAGSLEEAASAYRQAAEVEPGEPRYAANLAEVLLVLGERCTQAGDRDAGRRFWLEARSQLRRVLSLDPGYGQAATRLAQVEARLR